MGMRQRREGTTLLEVAVTVTILGILIVTFSGLLRAITVGGRNAPTTPGNVPTQQQVLDQINTFLTQFSRDVRGASTSSVENGGKKITLDDVVYEFQERTGEIKRKKGSGDAKIVLRGIYLESGNNEIFKQSNDSVVVTLPVRYRSQTGHAFEKKTFSFVVQRRVFSSPSPQGG